MNIKKKRVLIILNAKTILKLKIILKLLHAYVNTK